VRVAQTRFRYAYSAFFLGFLSWFAVCRRAAAILFVLFFDLVSQIKHLLIEQYNILLLDESYPFMLMM
jgi:hypothetical protein